MSLLLGFGGFGLSASRYSCVVGICLYWILVGVFLGFWCLGSEAEWLLCVGAFAFRVRLTVVRFKGLCFGGFVMVSLVGFCILWFGLDDEFGVFV